MPSSLQILDVTDTAFVDLFSLPNADGGIPSTSLAAKVVNAGDQTESNGYLRVLAAPDSSTAGVSYGLDVVDEGWIQIQIAGGEWVDCGAGKPVALPSLAAGAEVAIAIRTFAPADGQDHSPVIMLDAVSSPSPLVSAVHLPGGPGVVLPIHEPSRAAFLDEAGLAAGAGAFDVDLALWRWIAGGLLQSIVATTETLNDVDGDSSTLGAGEEYAAAFVGGPSGYQVLKGSKVAGTAVITDLPAIPSTVCFAGWVTVDSSGVVTVTASTDLELYRVRAATGLTVDVGAGVAVLDNRSPISLTVQSTTVTDDATSTVWLLPGGGTSVTSGAAPTAATNAIALAEVTAAAGVVTAVVDLRRFIGFRSESVTMRVVNASGLAVSDTGEPVGIPEGKWQIDPSRAAAAFLDDAGTAPTAGQTVLDIETRPLTSTTWTTLYTSQTASVPDQGLSIAYDSTTLSTDDSLPEVLQIQGPCLLRTVVAEIPTATTAPSGATLCLALVK